MVDIGTGLTALGTAEVTKDMLSKMLGPTAEYIGAGVQAWTERRTHNVQRVFAKTNDRLGNEIDRPGIVPPRVLRAVLDEAQFADDELIAEYLGGILASSRTESGRDDRAASAARLVSSLSSYAIRTHYVFYASARPRYLGVDAREFRTGSGADKRVYMSSSDYVAAMDFSSDELDNYGGILSDTLLALSRNDLIATNFVSGSVEYLRSGSISKDYPAPGLIFDPTQMGISMFCVAGGFTSEPYDTFVNAAAVFEVDIGFPLPQTTLVRDLPDYSGSAARLDVA
jgi:hypothetical protein